MRKIISTEKKQRDKKTAFREPMGPTPNSCLLWIRSFLLPGADSGIRVLFHKIMDHAMLWIEPSWPSLFVHHPDFASAQPRVIGHRNVLPVLLQAPPANKAVIEEKTKSRGPHGITFVGSHFGKEKGDTAFISVIQQDLFTMV
jgi:hypothetical protein